MQEIRYWRGIYANCTQIERDQIKQAVNKLALGQVSQKNIESLNTALNYTILSLRVNNKIRVLLIQYEGAYLLLEVLRDHNYHTAHFLKPGVLERFLIKDTSKTNILSESDFIPNQSNTSNNSNNSNNNNNQEPEKNLKDIKPFDFYNGKIITLKDEQEEVLNQNLPLIVSGGPGAGKSCIAISLITQYCTSFESSEKKKFLYLSHSPFLVRHMRDQWNLLNVLNKREDVLVEFKTYQELFLDLNPSYKTQDVVDENCFSRWFDSYKKSHHHFADIDANLLFQEFRNLAVLKQETYLNQKGRHSFFKDQNIRPAIYQAFLAYSQHLEANHWVELGFALLLQKNLYDLIIGDEAQDLTTQQLLNLYYLARNAAICYLMDSHQSLFDAQSKRPFLLEMQFQDKKPINHIQLSGTQRCSYAVMRFSNQILRIKNALVGGVSDKLEQPIVDLTKVGVKNFGHISWIEEFTSAQLQKIQKARENNANFAVITLKQHMQEAKELFGDPIFDVENTKGLEYTMGIAYRLLDDDLFTKGNKKLKTMPSLALNPNRPKDEEGIVFNPPFAKLFCSTTRFESLIFFQPQYKNINTLIHYLKTDSEFSSLDTVLENIDLSIANPQAWEAEVRKLIKLGYEAQAAAIWLKRLNRNQEDFQTLYAQLLAPERITSSTNNSNNALPLFSDASSSSNSNSSNNENPTSVSANHNEPQQAPNQHRNHKNKKKKQKKKKAKTAACISHSPMLNNYFEEVARLIGSATSTVIKESLKKLLAQGNCFEILFNTPLATITPIKTGKIFSYLFNLLLYQNHLPMLIQIFKENPKYSEHFLEHFCCLFPMGEAEGKNYTLFGYLSKYNEEHPQLHLQPFLKTLLENSPSLMQEITPEALYGEMHSTSSSNSLSTVSESCAFFNLCSQALGIEMLQDLFKNRPDLKKDLTVSALCKIYNPIGSLYFNTHAFYRLSRNKDLSLLLDLIKTNEHLIQDFSESILETKSWRKTANGEEFESANLTLWFLATSEIGCEILWLIFQNNLKVFLRETAHYQQSTFPVPYQEMKKYQTGKAILSRFRQQSYVDEFWEVFNSAVTTNNLQNINILKNNLVKLFKNASWFKYLCDMPLKDGSPSIMYKILHLSNSDPKQPYPAFTLFIELMNEYGFLGKFTLEELDKTIWQSYGKNITLLNYLSQPQYHPFLHDYIFPQVEFTAKITADMLYKIAEFKNLDDKKIYGSSFSFLTTHIRGIDFLNVLFGHRTDLKKSLSIDQFTIDFQGTNILLRLLHTMYGRLMVLRLVEARSALLPEIIPQIFSQKMPAYDNLPCEYWLTLDTPGLSLLILLIHHANEKENFTLPLTSKELWTPCLTYADPNNPFSVSPIRFLCGNALGVVMYYQLLKRNSEVLEDEKKNFKDRTNIFKLSVYFQLAESHYGKQIFSLLQPNEEKEKDTLEEFKTEFKANYLHSILKQLRDKTTLTTVEGMEFLIASILDDIFKNSCWFELLFTTPIANFSNLFSFLNGISDPQNKDSSDLGFRILFKFFLHNKEHCKKFTYDHLLTILKLVPYNIEYLNQFLQVFNLILNDSVIPQFTSDFFYHQLLFPGYGSETFCDLLITLGASIILERFLKHNPTLLTDFPLQSLYEKRGDEQKTKLLWTSQSQPKTACLYTLLNHDHNHQLIKQIDPAAFFHYDHDEKETELSLENIPFYWFSTTEIGLAIIKSLLAHNENIFEFITHDLLCHISPIKTTDITKGILDGSIWMNLIAGQNVGGLTILETILTSCPAISISSQDLWSPYKIENNGRLVPLCPIKLLSLSSRGILFLRWLLENNPRLLESERALFADLQDVNWKDRYNIYQNLGAQEGGSALLRFLDPNNQTIPIIEQMLDEEVNQKMLRIVENFNNELSIFELVDTSDFLVTLFQVSFSQYSSLLEALYRTGKLEYLINFLKKYPALTHKFTVEELCENASEDHNHSNLSVLVNDPYLPLLEVILTNNGDIRSKITPQAFYKPTKMIFAGDFICFSPFQALSTSRAGQLIISDIFHNNPILFNSMPKGHLFTSFSTVKNLPKNNNVPKAFTKEIDPYNCDIHNTTALHWLSATHDGQMILENFKRVSTAWQDFDLNILVQKDNILPKIIDGIFQDSIFYTLSATESGQQVLSFLLSLYPTTLPRLLGEKLTLFEYCTHRLDNQFYYESSFNYLCRSRVGCNFLYLTLHHNGPLASNFQSSHLRDKNTPFPHYLNLAQDEEGQKFLKLLFSLNRNLLDIEANHYNNYLCQNLSSSNNNNNKKNKHHKNNKNAGIYKCLQTTEIGKEIIQAFEKHLMTTHPPVKRDLSNFGLFQQPSRKKKENKKTTSHQLT